MEYSKSDRLIGEMRPIISAWKDACEEWYVTLAAHLKALWHVLWQTWRIVSTFTEIAWSKLKWLITTFPLAFVGTQTVLFMVIFLYMFVTIRVNKNNYDKRSFDMSQKMQEIEDSGYSKGYKQARLDVDANIVKFKEQIEEQKETIDRLKKTTTRPHNYTMKDTVVDK